MLAEIPPRPPALMEAEMDGILATTRAEEGDTPQVISFATDVEGARSKRRGKLVKKDRVEGPGLSPSRPEGGDPALQALEDATEQAHRLKAGISSSGRTSALPT